MTTATWTSQRPAGLETLSGAGSGRSWMTPKHFFPIVQGTSRSSLLEGRVVANLFLENSTRTRVSFSVAAHRLGAEVVDLLGSSASTSKGESLVDTASNIAAMGVDGIVIRCAASGGAELLAQHVNVPVINAGDGRHEHPTQGLLDLMTLLQHFGGNWPADRSRSSETSPAAALPDRTSGP